MKKDARPASLAHRHAECASYNGEDRGRFFKWYRKIYFMQELDDRVVDLGTVTEKGCIDPLRVVSQRLQMQPQHTCNLVADAGPQCFHI